MAGMETTQWNSARCPRCSGPVDARTSQPRIIGSAVRTYCSKACAFDDSAPVAPSAMEPEMDAVPRVSARAPIMIGALAGALVLWPHHPVTGNEVEVTDPDTSAPTQRAAFEPRRLADADEDVPIEIDTDDWVHPLRGPRRMPISHGRVFGAERPGDRPPSCRSGHCGVDIGGTWGEPVHAVADGVVARVVRRLNPDHGGRYVRIAHRHGTVFTQYFHLAAIPPDVHVGMHVRAGHMIGLLGRTGIKHSAPHLHFSISVKPSPDANETFIDPEPLIALWPIIDDGVGGSVASVKAPGVPVGASGRSRRGSRRRSAPPAAPAAAAGPANQPQTQASAAHAPVSLVHAD